MMGSDYFRWHDSDVRATVDGPRRPGIDRDSFIDGAIIDLNVSIGKGCVIRNRDNVQHYDGDGYYIRDGIIVIPKNACIPDGTVI